MYDKAVEEIKSIFKSFGFRRDVFNLHKFEENSNDEKLNKDLEQFLIKFEEESINYHKDTQ